MIRLATLLLCLCSLGCASSSPPRPLTQDDVNRAHRELEARGLPMPTALALSENGFIVADYELTDAEVSQRQPLRKFGESALLAIREALLKDGYEDYRVNVNGTPPGTGLVRRYGSARYLNGGTVEWITP